MKNKAIIGFLVSCFLLMGCGEGKETLKEVVSMATKVGKVKEGYFLDYSTTTIGKAFDNSFGNPNWEEKTTVKGQNYVEFNGNVDADFWNLLAQSLVDASETDPQGQLGYMYNCLGKEFTEAFISGSLSMAFSLAFVPESEAKELIKGAFINFLNTKPKRMTIQFVFNKRENADFELGYYGFQDEQLKQCNIQELIPMNEFLRFVYSNHVYTEFNISKVASEIVDQSGSVDQKTLMNLAKKRTSGMSRGIMYALLIALEVEPRVVKKKQEEKIAAEKKKKQEEEEAVRKAQEEAEQMKRQQEEKLRKSMKLIVRSMKSYKNKMDEYKKVEYDENGYKDYPYWNVIGFEPPDTDDFYIRESDGGSWNFSLYANENALGVRCHWIINCFNMDGCECHVSEDCKDISPNLKSLCDVEYDDY